MKPIARRPVRAALAASVVAAAFAAGCGGDTPEQLMGKARTALAAKDTKAAEIHLKNFLQQRPDDAQGRMLLAGLHAAARDHRSAEKEWLRALEAGAPAEQALPGLLAARVSLDDPKGALEALARFGSAKTAAVPLVAYWAGRAHAANGALPEAERSLRAALAAQPELHAAQTALVRLQVARGERKAAEAALDALLAKAPTQYDALLLKADLQAARQDVAGATATLARAIDAEPRDAEARIRLSALSIELNRLEDATAQLGELRRIAPGHPMSTHLGALIAFRQGRLDAARDGVQATLRGAPDFQPAIALGANVALAQGALELAEDYAKRIIDKAPASPVGPRLLATALMRRNEHERAFQLIKGALAKHPDDAALLGLAGEASLRRNDVAAATAYFERAIALDPKDSAKRTGLGLAQLSSGRPEAGLATLKAAAELDGASTQADLALISTLVSGRRFPEALAAIERLEKKQPGAPLPHNLRGTVLLGRGDLNGARASFARALEIDPAFFPAAANLAELDVRGGKPEDALKRLQEFVRREPRQVQAAIALAQLTSRTGGSRDDAIAILRQAHDANPAAVEPALLLGSTLVASNRPGDAISVLQQALARNVDSIPLLEGLSAAFKAAGQTQQAIDTFERRVRLEPGSAALHVRAGELRASLGDTGGAIGRFRQAAELDPSAPGPRFALASLLLKDGRKAEAERIAQALQNDAPDSASGLVLLGDIAAANGDWTEAAASYRKALSVQRTPASAGKLHQALLRANRAAEAETLLRDAVRVMPNDAGLRLYAGEQAVAARNWRLAVEQYDVALRLAPGHVVAMNNLAWALHELKDPRSLKVAADAYQRAPDAAPIADTFGVIQVARGDAKKGLELILRARTLAPAEPLYRLHYVEALVRTGDKAAARTEIAQIVRDHPDSPVATAARAIESKL